MANLDNTRQIVREVLKDTESRKLKWFNTFESEYEMHFKCTRQITEKKQLVLTVKSKRDKYNSELLITFGPIAEALKGGGTLTTRKEVGIITCKLQPLLYDLIDSLERKHRSGDISYIKENKVSEINTFGSTLSPDKLQNFKLIAMLTKNTQDGKLAWEDTFHDKHSATFIASFAMTPLKKLVFSVRCNDESEIKEDNILRCLMKVEKKGEKISHETSVIKSITLKEYPSFIALISKLNKKYLSRNFVSPFVESKTKFALAGSTDGFKVGRELDTNVEEYKKYGLNVIRTIIRELPGAKKDDWEEKFSDIYDAYEKVKKCKTIAEIDDQIFKAHSVQQKNPIGTPRWAR